jgi:hypothetical protein
VNFILIHSNSQSWLQPPFSGVPRPGRDALNRRQLQTNGLLKIKGLLELSLESGVPRPGRDVLSQRQPQMTDLLKIIKDLSELSLERRLLRFETSLRERSRQLGRGGALIGNGASSESI